MGLHIYSDRCNMTMLHCFLKLVWNPRIDMYNIFLQWIHGEMLHFEYLDVYIRVVQQRTWVRWLHLGKYCYNIMYHMSIAITPFRALYGYDALSFVDLAISDSRVPLAQDWVQENQDVIRFLRENLQ